MSKIWDPTVLVSKIQNPVQIGTDNELVIDLRNLEIECPFDLQNMLLKANFGYTQGRATCPYNICLDGSKFNNQTSIANVYFEKSFSAKKTDFNGVLYARGSRFQKTDFSNSVFFNIADLALVRFQDAASFLDCEFAKRAYFGESCFEGVADFSKSKFKDKAIFSKMEFEKSSSFIQCEFENLDFQETCFCESVSFGLAQFKKRVDFSRISFNSEAFFNRSLFADKAIFNMLVIEENTKVSFSEIIVEGTQAALYFEFDYYLGDFDGDQTVLVESSSALDEKRFIKFENLRFNESAPRIFIANISKNSSFMVVFKNCHFLESNVQLNNFYLSNKLKIWGVYGLKGFEFSSSCEWPKIPLVWGFRYLEWLNITGWPKIYSIPHEGCVFSSKTTEYAQLKVMANDQGESQLSGEFYARQMYCSLREYPNQPWKWFYFLSSMFGISILLPFVWWVVSFGFFGFLYWLAVGHITETWILKPIFDLTLSGINPLSHDIKINDLLNGDTTVITLIFWIQNIVVAYLYFQIGSAIRSRVRR